VYLRVERTDTPFTNRFREGQVVRMPIAHNEGNYIADAKTLKGMAAERQIVFRYCDADGRVTPEANPNGSTEAIAGLCNAAGNVLGLLPHPERAAEPVLGSADGRRLFESLIEGSP
jgi:phosphoribosylformylglycinamidine synthase